MSAPAHTPHSDGPFAFVGRVTASLDQALPFLGPGLAAVLGLVALGRAPIDVDEATTIDAVRGSFSSVLARAFEEDPARIGYLALLRPIVAWNDGEVLVRVPSVVGLVVATVAIYRLGRRLFDRRVGAVAAVILASSLGALTVAWSVGALSLALAAMLVSTAMFARAVERGGVVWWIAYALTAAALPLAHPIASAALGAQLAALAFVWRQLDLRVALPAVGVATLECLIFGVAAAIDRADAADGAGPLELDDLAAGLGRSLGWSPVVLALVVWGFVSMGRRIRHDLPTWKVALVAGLVGMPLVTVLAAGIVLPVYPREALTVGAGGLALAAATGLVALPDRSLRLASALAVVTVAVAALVTAGVAETPQDWRRAGVLARAEAGPRSSVVVVPARARSALTYYAPGLRLTTQGRGDAVTVVVAGDPDLAVAAARTVVSPPRYALLEQQAAGTKLVVQRWVRPGS